MKRRLDEIYSKSGIEIDTSLGIMVSSKSHQGIIVIYKFGKETRRVIWESDKNIKDLFRGELLDPKTINKINDWDIGETIYIKQKFSKSEIAKMINIPEESFDIV